MKYFILALLVLSLAAGVFAQEDQKFTIDGEVKTGILWIQNERINQDVYTRLQLGNQDDAGNDQGRIRINFSYSHANVGIKGRIQWDMWKNDSQAPTWPYLFGYVNSFNDQLTLSLGKLGASPWGTGGPEKWKELEDIGSGGGGMRVEYKPFFLPGLNAGFVLNWFNSINDQAAAAKVTIWDILKESVFGVSYDHEYFLVRFAYRLDSELDTTTTGAPTEPGDQGDSLIYRLEERMLKNYLPGFQIWALGVYEGVGAREESFIKFENWLFLQYAPDWGTAQIRLGYDVNASRSILHFKPSYYHNFFDKLISVGAAFYIANDFGEHRINDSAPYTEFQIEPMLRLNFQNAYIAFVYNFKQTYGRKNDIVDPPIERFQTINLRFGMIF